MEGAGLPALVRTRHRSFTIPFRLPASQDADAAPQRVLLSVSKNMGGTWESAGEVAPSAGSFTYQAEVDGEYWFRLRSVDRKGRMRGGEGPDMRVLVDAAGPRLAARVWKGTDGEIVCRYAAVDDSIRMDSLRLEYRVAAAANWKEIAAQGVLSREVPAHLVGEAIWWAGEKVDSLTLRIAVADDSGNQTVRQFTMETTDPGIDQGALASELGIPPLPSSDISTRVERDESRHAAPPAVAASAPRRPGQWTAEAATSWSAEQPSPAAAAAAAAHGPQTVLVRKAASAPVGSPPSPGGGIASELHARVDGDGLRLEYRGKPMHLSRSRRFAWDYEMPAERPKADSLRVELWSTRDAGVTWQRAAVDDDQTSPINVSLPAAGLYGFRLEIVPDLPGVGTGPRPGETADSWIGIDEDPPFVELLSVTPSGDTDAGEVVIRYTSRDDLPAPHAARILFSPHRDGPWATVAADLDNQGEHRWHPDRSTPSRVFVRVEIADAAGNVGTASSAEPITVSASRVVGKLGGLRTLPESRAP